MARGRLWGRARASNEWRFLATLRQAAPGLASTWWGLVLLRGALPAVFAITMGALVGAVQDGDSLGGPLTAVGITFVALQALSPVHSAVSTNLGARLSNWLHVRLMDACLTPAGLADLERADMADDLIHARDFDAGINAPPLTASLPSIGFGFAEILGGFTQAALLGFYRWWAPILVGGGWLSTHFLLRDSSSWRAYEDPGVTDAERHVDYAYRLAVYAPASKEVRLFGLSDWVVERFESRRRRMVELLNDARRLRSRPLQWALLTVGGGNLVFFWMLANDANRGAISLAALAVYAQAAIGSSALAFGEIDWWLRQGSQPVPRVLDLTERMAKAGHLSPGTRPADALPQDEIRLRGLHFTYESSDRPVFDGIDLTIPAGRSLAIVGQNGAGKTTLAKLLCRLYDPTGGSIEVDGIPLHELDVTSWRARIAAVFQDYVRFETTLRDNVAPRRGTPDDAVAEALRKAGAEDLAELDTVLSRQYEGGTDLSGGEWQRVALARALAAVEEGARVVLLDEPTAQLDVRGEAEIFDRILAATCGCTTILISHRFSTVRHADAICVLEHGKVVELGSHDELMERGGRYRTMFDLQASRFYEEPSQEAEEAGAGAD